MELSDTFKYLVVQNLEIKSKIHDRDKDGLWPYNFPKIALKENQINDFEIMQGKKLPFEYREFLKITGGWIGYMQCNDLVGIDYISNSKYMKIYDDVFLGLDDVWIEGVEKSDLLPISINTFDGDIFLISVNNCTLGKIYWIGSGNEIDRWDNFVDYFASIIEYNKRELLKLENAG
jgi:hypothetical protein